MRPRRVGIFKIGRPISGWKERATGYLAANNNDYGRHCWARKWRWQMVGQGGEISRSVVVNCLRFTRLGEKDEPAKRIPLPRFEVKKNVLDRRFLLLFL